LEIHNKECKLLISANKPIKIANLQDTKEQFILENTLKVNLQQKKNMLHMHISKVYSFFSGHPKKSNNNAKVKTKLTCGSITGPAVTVGVTMYILSISELSEVQMVSFICYV